MKYRQSQILGRSFSKGKPLTSESQFLKLMWIRTPFIKIIHNIHNLSRSVTDHFSLLLWIAFIQIFCACTYFQPTGAKTGLSTEGLGHDTYLRVYNKLEGSGPAIDYDTLMDIYKSLTNPGHPIPHMDQLLTLLIYKRNDNPRVDRMILIFSAQIIGKSKSPVPHVYELFESIINMDDSRINEWVLSFIGSAIGTYAFNIPDGDGLVELLEQRLDQIGSIPKDQREDFGSHFLPPPKNPFIRAYIANIEEKSIREMERRCYYSLILNNMSDNEIEAAVRHLQAQGIPGIGEKCPTPMRYLLLNVNSGCPKSKEKIE